jgi:outer membrane receptor protein involved in Fe transport
LLIAAWSALRARPPDNHVEGKVQTSAVDGKVVPLYGANVYWLGTTQGTITDEEGYFRLPRSSKSKRLVASFIGYGSDTLSVTGSAPVVFMLSDVSTLDNVEITYRQKSTQIDMLDARKVENISGKELLKAPCCNLSESFETSPSVDVSFTDAATGARQIQMLGLAGPNTQIMRENMPDVRGLSAIHGLTFIPGTWIDGIQVIKGTGSVINGFESIAGQINVNLKRPFQMKERLLLNAYASEGGRLEGNAGVRLKVGKQWGSAVLLHGSMGNIRHDRNSDGFLDMPLFNHFVALNRWEHQGEDGLHFEAGIKGTRTDKIGGETAFDRYAHEGGSNVWGMHLLMQRVEGWTKIGKVSQAKPWRSVGLQLSGATHSQHSTFGTRRYEGAQSTFYANLMYQTIIDNTNHNILTGASLQYDDYAESLDSAVYDRTEIVPGVFTEYTYKYGEKLDVVAGLRLDHHNLYGAFMTPRLHMRYAPDERTALRASAGRGLRTANIIAENSGMLASSRRIVIESENNGNPYGLAPEIAWNFGVNLTREFTIDYRDGAVSLDFYRTIFENQIVVDYDQEPQTVLFYNLDGRSFSNSFQAQVDYEIVKRVDLRIAYRWFDVQTEFRKGIRQKPLMAPHRFFVNAGYESRNHWKVDLTFNWQGSKRLPDTYDNPEPYRLPARSPAYGVVNAQVNKTWNEKLEVYIGAENLLDFRQEDPILASEDPFGPYFDSSMVWGPIFGRNVYAGLRYTLK